MDDIISIPPEREHAGQELGRVLQVAIHGNDDITSCVTEASEQSRLVPEIPRQADMMNPRISDSHVRNGCQRPVGTPVVNKDEFEGPAVATKDGRDSFVDMTEIRFFIER